MEGNMKMNCDLSNFNSVFDVDVAWNLVKRNVEMIFSNFSEGFVSVPYLTTASLFRPSTMFLAVLEPRNEQCRCPDHRGIVVEDDVQYRYYDLIGPIHKFVVDASRNKPKQLYSPFSEPVVNSFEDSSLPRDVTITLNDVPNKRRIKMTAYGIFRTTTKLADDPKNLNLSLNNEALKKLLSTTPTHRSLRSDRKRPRHEDPVDGDSRSSFREVNVITDTISAKRLEIYLYMNELCRFLEFSKGKPILFKYQTFKVSKNNKIQFSGSKKDQEEEEDDEDEDDDDYDDEEDDDDDDDESDRGMILWRKS